MENQVIRRKWKISSYRSFRIVELSSRLRDRKTLDEVEVSTNCYLIPNNACAIVSPTMNSSAQHGTMSPKQSFGSRRYTEINNSVIAGIKMRE